MASVVMESKVTDISAETIQVIEVSGDGPVSSVDTMGVPQGDQHVTMSSSVVESSDSVPVSTTMSTSTVRDSYCGAGDEPIQLTACSGQLLWKRL